MIRGCLQFIRLVSISVLLCLLLSTPAASAGEDPLMKRSAPQIGTKENENLIPPNPPLVKGGRGDFLVKLKVLYKGLQTLDGRFRQVTYIKDLEKGEYFEGVFYLKAPDMMKWKYTKGSTDEVYLRGDEMVIYQPRESQAFVASIDRYGLSSSPLRMLLNLGEVGKDFDVTEREGHLFLKPVKEKTVADSIEVVLSENDFPIDKIIMLDRYGNSTEITLMDVKINTRLSDSLFLFTPPEGTVVIRQ